MGWLGCFWSFSSFATIVNSNKCQLVSSSSLFIGGEGMSCPIESLMRWVDEAFSWILVFGFGESFLSVSMVGSTGMVSLSNSIRLLRDFDFGQLRFCRVFFSSTSFHDFQSSLFFYFLVRLWWSILCSLSQSTTILLSLRGWSDHHNYSLWVLYIGFVF